MREILLFARDRTAMRRQVRMPCQIVEEAGFSLLAETCLDLSIQGMRVRALAPAPVGTRVLASFRVPGSSLYIDAEAEVTRVLWGRRYGDETCALGLNFIGMLRVDRAILASRLQGLPPPPPKRSVRVDYARTVFSIAKGFVPAQM